MFKNSRYIHQKAFPYLFRDGARIALTFRIIDRDVPVDSRLHVIKIGDTLDLLAFQYLGSGELWWVIADLNPHVEPWDLRNYIGVEVVIPTRREAARKQRATRRVGVDVRGLGSFSYVWGES